MIHSIISRKFVILWCLFSTTLSVPSSSPKKSYDELYTTSRPSRTIVELKITPRPIPKSMGLLKTTTGETSTTTAAPQAPKILSGGPVLYRLNSPDGRACILLQVDALVSAKYRTTFGDERTANIYVPDDATVTGNCEKENFVTMSLKWDAYVLSWSFAKTPGGERWYVDKIELTYNSSDRHFEHIDQPKKTVRLSTNQKYNPTLFPTPVGKSFTCEEIDLPLSDGKNNATLELREIQLQPFKFKTNDFAESFSCKSLSARAGRDETAPVAVGSTLAAAVLLTITGYAGWRYFKIKKVKYDTME
ncbi:uncharacterized protein LOC107037669 [Diachasma alloeum]|uniref:uncharacterized protein LOC107037669 n=1 Tax=Diachasma alloeum TaxID=454923 RepID=UPI00073836F9|nr:uncharacterized protein LOC107037669 [Diachasma alloeum]